MKALIAIRFNTKLKLILVLITRLSLRVGFFFLGGGIPNALPATSCALTVQFLCTPLPVDQTVGNALSMLE